jgi:hypothetical protein
MGLIAFAHSCSSLLFSSLLFSSFVFDDVRAALTLRTLRQRLRIVSLSRLARGLEGPHAS